MKLLLLALLIPLFSKCQSDSAGKRNDTLPNVIIEYNNKSRPDILFEKITSYRPVVIRDSTGTHFIEITKDSVRVVGNLDKVIRYWASVMQTNYEYMGRTIPIIQGQDTLYVRIGDTVRINCFGSLRDIQYANKKLY
jgi:hypothetical protein